MREFRISIKSRYTTVDCPQDSLNCSHTPYTRTMQFLTWWVPARLRLVYRRSGSASRAVRQCLVLTVAVAVVLAAHGVAFASEPCNPPNVIPQSVCDMDSFHSSGPGQVPDGWTEFILLGSPSFDPDPDTVWGAPSLRIRIFDEAFKAGIYTQVPVTPGAGYRASVAWGAPNTPDTFGRQLGIDPTGGTDPNSPNIIWGPMHWGPARMLNYPPPDVNIDVLARAAGDVMTVFFLVDHIANVGDNLIFIDAIALYPDENAPAIEIPPTDTPQPPTDTPAPVVVAAALPTDTPLPPTETASPTPTPTPTDTPTPTPTNTPLPTATSTATPTWTPWPVATEQSGLTAWSEVPAEFSEELVDTAVGASPMTLAMLTILGFGSAGVLGGSFVYLRRKR
jgi:hypothetical protein